MKKTTFGCYSDDKIRTFDDIDLKTNDDFMKKLVEKDLSEKYHVYPPMIKYNYPLHFVNLRERDCNSEDERRISIENIEEIEQYKRKVNLGLKDTNYKIMEDTFEQVGTTQGKKRKGYGMKNPVENYFQYVNKDKQRSEHLILPFPRGGYMSRILNFDFKN
jgi:hypothetical protein